MGEEQDMGVAASPPLGGPSDPSPQAVSAFGAITNAQLKSSARTLERWTIGRLPTVVVSDRAAADEVNGSSATEYYGGYLVAESVAPSRGSLIAAAPDLLADAKALREAQHAYMADRGNEALGRAVGVAAEQLDASIAKAEGQ